MSRHRRQRHRRWRTTRGKVDQEMVGYGKRVWSEHGKVSSALEPLERLVVEAWIKKEQVRLWKLAEVRAGRMVMIPIGWNFLSPEQQDTGWKKVKSITVTKLSFDKPRTNVKHTT